MYINQSTLPTITIIITMSSNTNSSSNQQPQQGTTDQEYWARRNLEYTLNQSGAFDPPARLTSTTSAPPRAQGSCRTTVGHWYDGGWHYITKDQDPQMPLALEFCDGCFFCNGPKGPGKYHQYVESCKRTLANTMNIDPVDVKRSLRKGTTDSTVPLNQQGHQPSLTGSPTKANMGLNARAPTFTPQKTPANRHLRQDQHVNQPSSAAWQLNPIRTPQKSQKSSYFPQQRTYELAGGSDQEYPPYPGQMPPHNTMGQQYGRQPYQMGPPQMAGQQGFHSSHVSHPFQGVPDERVLQKSFQTAMGGRMGSFHAPQAEFNQMNPSGLNPYNFQFPQQLARIGNHGNRAPNPRSNPQNPQRGPMARQSVAAWGDYPGPEAFDSLSRRKERMGGQK
jgi:hypothetical protein